MFKNKYIEQSDLDKFPSINVTFFRFPYINKKTFYKIGKLHLKRFEIYDLMKKTDSSQRLIQLSKKVTKIEFKLQKLWGFKANIKFHRWFDVPKCKCSKLDNEENIGSNFKIITNSCPIHQLHLQGNRYAKSYIRRYKK